MIDMFQAVILTVTRELSLAEFDALLSFVSPAKQERIQGFRLFRDARNTLLGDILARVELSRATGKKARRLVFSKSGYGKPFLENNPHAHFNLSHSGPYIACVTAGEPVGIDIELFRPIDLRLAERFFSPEEMEYVKHGRQIRRFFEVWTKKESRIKWEGMGLSKHLPSFSVIGGEKPPTYHKVFLNEEAICHVCSSSEAPPSVRVTDLDAWMNQAKEHFHGLQHL